MPKGIYMRKKINKNCLYCKEDFLGFGKTLFCSNSHQQNFHNQRRRDKGLITSNNQRSQRFIRDIDYFKVIKISIPYSRDISKNSIFGRRNFGNGLYVKAGAKKFKEDLFFLIKNELNKKKIIFVEDKIWLDIFIQKPRARGDAINSLDLIADAIKIAIGVDDKWFSIKSLDWEVKKENPMIFIEIGQSDNIIKKICSACGRILPREENFKINKARNDGYYSMCKKCFSPRKEQRSEEGINVFIKKIAP